MLKEQVKTLDDVEEYFNSCPKLKLAVDKEYPTVESVLHDMIGLRMPTKFVKAKRISCVSNKLRTLYDVVRCVKYYFPELTVAEILEKICDEAERLGRLTWKRGGTADLSKGEKLFANNPSIDYCSDARGHTFRRPMLQGSKDWMVRRAPLSYLFDNSKVKSVIIKTTRINDYITRQKSQSKSSESKDASTVL